MEFQGKSPISVDRPDAAPSQLWLLWDLLRWSARTFVNNWRAVCAMWAFFIVWTIFAAAAAYVLYCTQRFVLLAILSAGLILIFFALGSAMNTKIALGEASGNRVRGIGDMLPSQKVFWRLMGWSLFGLSVLAFFLGPFLLAARWTVYDSDLIAIIVAASLVLLIWSVVWTLCFPFVSDVLVADEVPLFEAMTRSSRLLRGALPTIVLLLLIFAVSGTGQCGVIVSLVKIIFMKFVWPALYIHQRALHGDGSSKKSETSTRAQTRRPMFSKNWPNDLW